MVAARHLHNWGVQMNVILVGDETKLKEIPQHQWKILKYMDVIVADYDTSRVDLILDAMLGYGVQGNPREPIANWIRRTNESKIPILALDAPSGLDTTTGVPASPCIRAHATPTRS